MFGCGLGAEKVVWGSMIVTLDACSDDDLGSTSRLYWTVLIFKGNWDESSPKLPSDKAVS